MPWSNEQAAKLMLLSRFSLNQCADYGYSYSTASCAHGYLLPALFREVAALAKERTLKIVDLGCGNGYVASQLAVLGYRVTGVDVSSEGIKIARASFPNVSYHWASIYDDDLSSVIKGPFDCVVSVEVIEHLFYPKKLFEQSQKLEVERGTLILSTPYHGYFKNLALSLTNGWDRHFGVEWDGGHIKFFSETTLARMASNAGFTDIRFSRVGRLPGLWKSMIMVARKKD